MHIKHLDYFKFSKILYRTKNISGILTVSMFF